MSRLADQLYRLALEHDGILTSRSASANGLSHASLVNAARRRTLIKLSRGIYRYAKFPIDEERAQLWEAVLWSTVDRTTDAPPGVLSHLTALKLIYDSLEYAPPHVDVTVSQLRRIRRQPPNWLKLHSGLLAPHEVTESGNLPHTTIERTLTDCLHVGVDRRFILRVAEALTHREHPFESIAEDVRLRVRELVG